MGSYASLHYYDEHDEYDIIQFASMFDHKFFGYIEDDECAAMASYKYLLEIRDLPVMYVNQSYIGTICRLTKQEALKFMMLYSKDYCISEDREQFGMFDGWDREIDDLPEDIILYLSFD